MSQCHLSFFDFFVSERISSWLRFKEPSLFCCVIYLAGQYGSQKSFSLLFKDLHGPQSTLQIVCQSPQMGWDGCRWQGMWQVGYGIKRVNMNLHTTLGDTLINNISFWWTLALIMLFLGDTTTHEKMIRRYKKLFLERYWAITSNFSCLLWTLLINYHFGDFSKLLEPTIFGMMPSLNSTYKYWIVNLWSRYCLVTLVCQMLTTLLWWFYSNPGPQIVNLESHMGDSLKCL